MPSRTKSSSVALKRHQMGGVRMAYVENYHQPKTHNKCSGGLIHFLRCPSNPLTLSAPLPTPQLTFPLRPRSAARSRSASALTATSPGFISDKRHTWVQRGSIAFRLGLQPLRKLHTHQTWRPPINTADCATLPHSIPQPLSHVRSLSNGCQQSTSVAAKKQR